MQKCKENEDFGVYIDFFSADTGSSMKRQWDAPNGMGNGGLLPMLMPGDDLPDGNLLVNSKSNFFKETMNRRRKLIRWKKSRDYFSPVDAQLSCVGY